MTETGHLLRAAVGDEGAQRIVVAAERGAREHRRVLRARHLRLGVADAAGLVEEPLPDKLALVQCLRAGSGPRRGEYKGKDHGASLHSPPPSRQWTAALDWSDAVSIAYRP